MNAKIRVTVEDMSGEQETSVAEVEDDYILVCAGKVYLSHIQTYPKSGTTVLTIKREKAA